MSADNRKRERDPAAPAPAPEAKTGETKVAIDWESFDEDFKKLLERIRTESSQPTEAPLTKVEFEGRQLKKDGVFALAALLLDNPHITSLKLGYNRLGDEAAEKLASLFIPSQAKPNQPSRVTPIKEFSIPDSDLTDNGVKVLIEAFEKSNTLTALDLSRNRLSEASCARLGAWLENPACSLQSLDLCMNNLTQASIAALRKGLETTKNLHTLILHNNKLQLGGFKTLIYALAKNHSISTLDVAVNGLETECCKLLAQLLDGTLPAENGGSAEAKEHSRTRLSRLELCSNQIGPDGCAVLAKAIANNHTINHLDLVNNDVQDAGRNALKEALQTNPFITFINFGTIDEETNKIIERNKIFSLRLVFLHGKYSNSSSTFNSFFHHALYDRNLLKVVFGYLH